MFREVNLVSSFTFASHSSEPHQPASTKPVMSPVSSHRAMWAFSSSSVLICRCELASRKARAFRDANSHLHINTLEELKAHIARCEETGDITGFVLAGWCGSDECEAKVKEETKFTSRNIPFHPPVQKHVCITCGGEAKYTVWFARAY